MTEGRRFGKTCVPFELEGKLEPSILQPSRCNARVASGLSPNMVQVGGRRTVTAFMPGVRGYRETGEREGAMPGKNCGRTGTAQV